MPLGPKDALNLVSVDSASEKISQAIDNYLRQEKAQNMPVAGDYIEIKVPLTGSELQLIQIEAVQERLNEMYVEAEWDDAYFDEHDNSFVLTYEYV
jgi:hypothetical protein